MMKDLIVQKLANWLYAADAKRAADEVLSALLSAPDSVRLELAGMLNPWRAIDEAPKDGTKIFAYCVANGHPYMTVIWWRGDKYKTWGEPGYQWRNSLNDSATGGFAETLPNPGPTHWLPLPAPPSEDKPK